MNNSLRLCDDELSDTLRRTRLGKKSLQHICRNTTIERHSRPKRHWTLNTSGNGAQIRSFDPASVGVSAPVNVPEGVMPTPIWNPIRSDTPISPPGSFVRLHLKILKEASARRCAECSVWSDQQLKKRHNKSHQSYNTQSHPRTPDQKSTNSFAVETRSKHGLHSMTGSN